LRSKLIYRSSALPPISRLEHSSTLRRRANLRSTLAAVVTLLTTSLERTYLALSRLTSPRLLGQILQVYNVPDSPSDGDELDGGSIADLRARCLAMHDARRRVLCSILAMDVKPEDPEWSKWRVVIRESSSLTGLLGGFTRELDRSLSEDEGDASTREGANVVFEPAELVSQSRLDHSRGLTALSTSLRLSSAKLSLLTNELASLLPNLPPADTDSLLTSYDSLGNDLHSLLDSWTLGRESLTHRTSSPGRDFDEGSICDSGLGVSLPDIISEKRKRDSCGDWGLGPQPILHELTGITEEPDPSETTSAEDSLAGESVLEGTAVGRLTGVSFARGTSRAERIERARREREEGMLRRKVEEERRRWVGELKDVLLQRGH
jgi:Mysoin-binding motif of peroxisomes